MRLLDPQSEIKTIISLLDNGNNEVQSTLLSKLAQEHFAFDQMNLCFKLITAIAATSSIPNLHLFLLHPQLPQEAKDILQTTALETVRSPEQALELIGILEYWRKLRRSYELTTTLAAKMKGETPPEINDMLGEIEKALGDLRTVDDAKKTWHVGLGYNSEELIKGIMSVEKPKLIPSTFNNFDSKTGGFGSQDFFVVASHAKGGKSIMSLNMCVNMYLKFNLNIIMFSLEMRAWEVTERIMACLTGIEHGRFRQRLLNDVERRLAEKSWRDFNEHGLKNNCRFTLKDTTSLTVPEFKLECKNRGYDVACIDYINLMRIPNQKGTMQDWERISVLGRDLKEATKECNLMIMAPTQMNDDGQLRYSKALLEHANTVWTWTSKDEETRATHQLKINQPVVRGWAPFQFMLREDFERCQVFDGAMTVQDEEDFVKDRKDKMKKMYNDD
jgi:replicative DNA helicase